MRPAPPLLPSRIEGWGQRWFPFAIVGAIYAAVALHQITLSGVYMDEVHPDYLAVRVLNWTDPPIPAWVLPGNYLFDRFPVLVSLQHGTQTLWLGLPVFWLLGTTVASLRIAHALFALGILAALYAMLCAAGVRRWWGAAACAAVAIDPAFVYAFRTQSSITLAPAAWLFLSLFAYQRATRIGADALTRWLVASGFFLGFAFSGYFIYLFFAPAVALAVLSIGGPGEACGERLRHLLYWSAGFTIATLPYVFGYALLARSQGGLIEGWKYIVATQAQLGGQPPPLTLEGRFAQVKMLVDLTFSNAAHHWLIFGKPVPAIAAGPKMALLLAAPPILWLVAEYRKQATPLLRTLLGMQLSFAVFALAFAGRIAGHHYIPLVPTAYATLAAALWAVTATVTSPLSRWVFAIPFAVLFGLNAAGDAREAVALRETGGVGMYSDAINRLADDLLSEHSKGVVFFPDWGLFMSQAFLTGGKVEMSTAEDFALARRVVCAGRDVSVALIQGDRMARFAEWQQRLDAGAPVVKDYRQRDGVIVFSLGTFRGHENGQRCQPS